MVKEVMDLIAAYDGEVGAAIQAEYDRQSRNLELIASENIVSEPVMMAMGTVLTNKYAEGYPGKRYYGGCQNVDVVESIAIERAKKLFGCDYANVQPHSGAQANMAVFVAMLKPALFQREYNPFLHLRNPSRQHPLPGFPWQNAGAHRIPRSWECRSLAPGQAAFLPERPQPHCKAFLPFPREALRKSERPVPWSP